MARDLLLLTKRNTQIRADFNRLKSEERPCNFKGTIFYVRLTSDQAIHILSGRYHLSHKQIENVLYATQPQPAPLKSAA